jgi:hypothetical protein
MVVGDACPSPSCVLAWRFLSLQTMLAFLSLNRVTNHVNIASSVLPRREAKRNMRSSSASSSAMCCIVFCTMYMSGRHWPPSHDRIARPPWERRSVLAPLPLNECEFGTLSMLFPRRALSLMWRRSCSAPIYDPVRAFAKATYAHLLRHSKQSLDAWI